MINNNIDLGQLIVAVLVFCVCLLITIVGYFIKKEIHKFGARLDKHEEILFNMTSTVQRVVGEVGVVLRLFSSSSNILGK